MCCTILVRSDILKSLNSTEGTELSAEEKIRKILELRVQEAKTEDEREAAVRELQHFKSASVARSKSPLL